MPRRILLGITLILLLVSVGTASAGYRWQDPIYEVEGTRVLVDVAYHNAREDDMPALIAGTHVTLYVPAGVDARLIDAQGNQAEVAWDPSLTVDGQRVPVVAEVRVPDEYDGQRYRARVLVEAGNSKSHRAGWSDAPIRVETEVRR